MSSFTDMCKNTLEVTKDYVLYRNRLLDTKAISTFRTKGKRLMINSYKQNSGEPTMLVMFSSKEDAHSAFEGLKSTLYPAPLASKNSWMDDTSLFGMSVFFMFLSCIVGAIAYGK
jgi:hypothetical protein